MKWMSYPIFESFLQKTALFLLLMAVPVWAQHKTSAPAPHSAPTPHASAPVHNSAPARNNSAPAQHSNMPGRSNPAGTMGHTNTNTAGHTNPTMGRTNTNPAGHSNANTMGHTNTTNGRPGTTNAGRTAGMNNGAHNTAMGGAHNNAMNSGHPAGGGGHIGNRTMPGRQVSLRGGGSASIRPNGQIRSVNRNGMQINRGLHGGRTVVSTHNGVRVVSVGHRGGYVQRAYVVRGGHSYYSRTYYYHGGYRVGVYRGYYWGGHPYYGYYPDYYYHPAFYGWAYNPWPAPVYWGWGWGAAPWYGYYGPYYAPYPVYPSAAFWVADFMIAASLQAAYEAQAAEVGWLGPDHDDAMLVASLVAPAAPDTQVKMSPEVKNALSEEIKATLAAEQSEAGKSGSSGANSGGGVPATSNEAPPALDPKIRTFLVSSDTSLVAGDDDECALSQGDVIERTSDKADNDGNVTVKVVASNKKDCAIGKEGPISTDDLQEMYNNFREQVKDGMADLAKKQGTGGLPKAPDTSTTSGDVPPPAPDKSAEKSLQDQSSAADQAESDVKQEASSGSGGGGF